jgi:hypothetical protein
MYRHNEPNGLTKDPTSYVRGVLGNKCAEWHNLKTVYIQEIIVSDDFVPWLSAICVFFAAFYLLQEGGSELLCSDGGG